MYCRKPVLPIEHEMLDSEMLKFRKTLFSKANTNIKNAQDRQKRDYDRKHHRQMEWKPGTLVWLRNSTRDTRKKKFLPRWLGPYKIVKCLDKNVYRIARLSTGVILKKAVNGCRLKAYHKPIEKPASYPTPRLCDSFLFQYGTPEASISSDAGLSDDDTIPPLLSPMPPLNELTRKPRAPVISDDEDLDDTIPPLPSPMPPLNELIQKTRAPIISQPDDKNLDDAILAMNGFESFTTSTPVLKGGFFPEFFPGTAPSLPSPIPTELPSTQPTIAQPLTKPTSTQPTQQLTDPTSTPTRQLTEPTSTQPTLVQPPNQLRKRKNNAAKDIMFCRRQKRVRRSSYQDAITVEDYKLKQPLQLQKLWLPELNLAKSDQDILLNPTAWMTDSLMDAAQLLL